MALIRMMGNDAKEFPQGAYCPIGHYNTEHEFFRREEGNTEPELELRSRRALVLYKTHEGLCIAEREHNGDYDSDFLMLVWNPEKGIAQWIEFASTRGWTYPCYGSNVDATPETLAAYKEWQQSCIHRNAVLAKWQARKVARLNRVKSSLTLEQYKRLASAYSADAFEACLKLLSTKLRSDFKKSLAKQLRDWLDTASPRFNKPFSPKQLSFIMPQNGYRYY